MDITFKNHCFFGTIAFLGLWFSIALVHVFITWIFIIEASCIHVCLKTLLFMNFLIYSFQCTSKPISLGFPFIHVCLKTLLFMNEILTRDWCHIYNSEPISLGFPCIHVCSKTLLFMNGLLTRDSCHIYTPESFSLGLPCIHVFKNTTSHEWAFYKIFISFPYTLYWWQRYLFQV